EREDITDVLLIARWALSIEGDNARGEKHRWIPLKWIDRPNVGKPSLDNNPDMFREALAETIEAIRATGRRVVLIGNVPEIPWDADDRVEDLEEKGRPLPRPPSREAVVARQGRADAILEEAAAQEGVTFLSILDRLCAESCDPVADGRPLYEDLNHMTAFGAELIVTPLLLESVWPEDGSEAAP
ncbi:MAG: hypothetical protein MI723_11225, partial [Caulobacterales bacterium]|nr:hypothetical protein [Caulobacterales bacterium]